MKVLVMDTEGEGTGVDIALRAHDYGHDVRFWTPDTRGGNRRPHGDNLVPKVMSWQSSMDWAELIIATGNNKYATELGEYFAKGYPLFATNAKSAELELDRGLGQEVLSTHGVRTISYKVVHSVEEAIKHVVKTDCGYALKPWGGDAASAMTAVCKDANEAIFTLTKWEKEGLFKGSLMMQELVEGVEIGISGFFGPNGWLSALEESFEHKKFLTGDLGENTGEMGTVIRHVTKSKLFDMVLDPITDYLHLCKYVGDCSVNCIIDSGGEVWPLEFTMRLGWPDFCIRQEVFRGDPVKWMLDLLHGRDTLEVTDRTAVGVLLTHGDFPKCKDGTGVWAGYPIEGVTDEVYKHLHFQQCGMGLVPRLAGGKIKQTKMITTTGPYVLVATGSASTVSNAKKKAYGVIDAIDIPSNGMHRLDIGDRLKEDLPKVQKFGFAEGMVY